MFYYYCYCYSYYYYSYSLYLLLVVMLLSRLPRLFVRVRSHYLRSNIANSVYVCSYVHNHNHICISSFRSSTCRRSYHSGPVCPMARPGPRRSVHWSNHPGDSTKPWSLGFSRCCPGCPVGVDLCTSNHLYQF